MSFQAFRSIPRLNRNCSVTEKLDGTNGQIFIVGSYAEAFQDDADLASWVYVDKFTVGDYEIAAGSRNRWLGHHSDNYGFYHWARDNKEELVKLGPGRHFGEWWGKGINRGYGLNEKRFSLFNRSRWADDTVRPKCCFVVPQLYHGLFDTKVINDHIGVLVKHGSLAAPGFMNPEGIVVYHEALNHSFKATCHKDEKPKSLAEQE